MHRTNTAFLSPVLSSSQRQFDASSITSRSTSVEKIPRAFQRQVNLPFTEKRTPTKLTSKDKDLDLQAYLKTLSRKSAVRKKIEVDDISDISLSDEDSEILNTENTLPASRFLKKSAPTKSDLQEIEKNTPKRALSPTFHGNIKHNSPEIKTIPAHLSRQSGESSEESLVASDELSLNEGNKPKKKSFLKKSIAVDTFGKLQRNNSPEMLIKAGSHLQPPPSQYNKTSAVLNKVALYSQKYLKKPSKLGNHVQAKEDLVESEGESKASSLRMLKSEGSQDLNFEKELIKELSKVDVSLSKTKSLISNKIGNIKRESDSNINISSTIQSEESEAWRPDKPESDEEMVIENTFEGQSDGSDSQYNNLLDLDQLELATTIDKYVNLSVKSTESQVEDSKPVEEEDDGFSEDSSHIKTEKSVSSESDLDYSEEFEDAEEVIESSEDSRDEETIPSVSEKEVNEVIVPLHSLSEEVEGRSASVEEKVESFKSQSDKNEVVTSLSHKEGSLPDSQKDAEESFQSFSQKEVESLPSLIYKDVESLTSYSHKFDALPSQGHKEDSIATQSHKYVKSSSSPHSYEAKEKPLSFSDSKSRVVIMESPRTNETSHTTSPSSQAVTSSKESLSSRSVKSKKMSKKRILERTHRKKTPEMHKVDVAVQATASFYIPEAVYFSTPSPIAINLEALSNYNPEMLALTDLLSQQLELTKNFIRCQENLYRTWTRSLDAKYHYTSLRETKEMIHHHRKEAKRTLRKSRIVLL